MLYSFISPFNHYWSTSLLFLFSYPELPFPLSAPPNYTNAPNLCVRVSEGAFDSVSLSWSFLSSLRMQFPSNSLLLHPRFGTPVLYDWHRATFGDLSAIGNYNICWYRLLHESPNVSVWGALQMISRISRRYFLFRMRPSMANLSIVSFVTEYLSGRVNVISKRWYGFVKCWEATWAKDESRWYSGAVYMTCEDVVYTREQCASYIITFSLPAYRCVIRNFLISIV